MRATPLATTFLETAATPEAFILGPIQGAPPPFPGLSDLATPSGPPSDLLTQCQALDRQRSATREGSMAPAAARADRLSRHLRQDLAREQLQGRNVFLVEHLEEHPLDAHLLPRLEVGDDALRRAGEERRSVPGRLLRREGGEEGAGGGDALGDVGRVAPDGAREHEA